MVDLTPEEIFFGVKYKRDNFGKRIYYNRGGENQYLAKFSNEEAKMIKKEYEKGGVSTRSLAKKYGVSQMTIYAMVKGKSYKTTT